MDGGWGDRFGGGYIQIEHKIDLPCADAFPCHRTSFYRAIYIPWPLNARHTAMEIL
jgi:hypothetical protein